MNRLNNSSNDQSQQQKTEKREGFDPIDRNFWEDGNLSGNDIRIQGWLNSHNYKEYQPGLDEITEKIHLSKNTILRSIKNLVANNYLLVVQVDTKYGYKNVYIPTSKMKAKEQKQGAKTDIDPPPNFAPLRKSNIGKANNIHNDVYDINDPATPKPEAPPFKGNVVSDEFEKHEVNSQQITLHKLKRKIVDSIHGKKGFDFIEANQFYKDLILKYGAQNTYDSMTAFLRGKQGKHTRWGEQFAQKTNRAFREKYVNEGAMG